MQSVTELPGFLLLPLPSEQIFKTFKLSNSNPTKGGGGFSAAHSLPLLIHSYLTKM